MTTTSLPNLGQLSLYDNIYRDYKNKDKIDVLKKYFDVPYLLPKEFEEDMLYLKYLESLISNAYAYACLGHYNKSLSYYSFYQDKTIKLNQIRNKIVSLINEIMGYERCILDFDSIWFELSRISSISNFEYKSLYDRVRNYKDNKANQDIISRRNILHLLIKNIEEVYNSEVKRMIDKPVLSIQRSDRTLGVEFDTIEKRYNIFGRSVADAKDAFWEKVLNWTLKNKLKLFAATLTVNIDYFGSSSAPSLYKLINLFYSNGSKIVWRYDPNDSTMIESGKDFEDLCISVYKRVENAPKFEFKPNIMEKVTLIENESKVENKIQIDLINLVSKSEWKDWKIKSITKEILVDTTKLNAPELKLFKEQVKNGTRFEFVYRLLLRNKKDEYILDYIPNILTGLSDEFGNSVINKKIPYKLHAHYPACVNQHPLTKSVVNKDFRKSIAQILKSSVTYKDWTLGAVNEKIDNSGFIKNKFIRYYVNLSKENPNKVFKHKELVFKSSDGGYTMELVNQSNVGQTETADPKKPSSYLLAIEKLINNGKYAEWKMINVVASTTSRPYVYNALIRKDNKEKTLIFQSTDGGYTIRYNGLNKTTKNFSDRGDI